MAYTPSQQTLESSDLPAGDPTDISELIKGDVTVAGYEQVAQYKPMSAPESLDSEPGQLNGDLSWRKSNGRL